MLKKIETKATGKITYYTDLANNVKKVTHSIVLKESEKKENKEQMLTDINNVFMHKAD